MRAFGFFVLLLLTACEREPTFDERYEHALRHIDEKTKELDAAGSQQSEQNEEARADEVTSEQ